MSYEMKDVDGIHMGEISFVFPNVGTANSKNCRRGLLNRWSYAQEYGFDFIELPAHFVRDSEEEIGLIEGDFLTRDAIKKLYTKDLELPSELKYIMHTEPALSSKCHLKWFSKPWVKQFIKMQTDIVNYLGTPPTMIEIHPGKRPNTNQYIAESAVELFNTFKDKFDIKPLILIENRSDQVISNGVHMKEFWDYLTVQYPSYRKHIGFVVDFRTLYTRVSKEHPINVNGHFIENIGSIPNESIKGCHIHNTHTKAPTPTDEVPWLDVFKKIKSVEKDLILNPEVFTTQNALKTREFCKYMLNKI